jgi:hypothetical protein
MTPGCAGKHKLEVAIEFSSRQLSPCCNEQEPKLSKYSHHHSPGCILSAISQELNYFHSQITFTPTRLFLISACDVEPANRDADCACKLDIILASFRP